MPLVPMRDGAELYVRVIGRGAPVMLLPGLGMHSAHWLPFIAPYLGKHRFYLPDLRGAGRSSHLRLTRADVFQTHADDVADVLTSFRLDDFMLGGISLGCTTAMHLLRDYGWTGVRAYLHVDQSPCVGNRADWHHGLFGPEQETRFALFREALALLDAQRDATDILARIMAMISGDEARAPRLRLLMRSPLAGLLPLRQRDDVRVYLRAYLAGGHDYRPALEDVTTPITLIFGRHSALYPSEGQRAIAALAKNVQVIPFERSGHVPLLDEPAKFIRTLGQWLHGASITRS